MNDHELQQLLKETHPIKPGQEARAWMLLREKLQQPARRSAWAWLWTPSWGLTASLLMVGWFIVVPICDLVVAESHEHIALASANSQAPGIYATSFYSHSAKAQVVWLDGMEPITGRPTYLDPTTSAPGAKPPTDPYSL